MIIDGRVFDVTPYLKDHPGGDLTHNSSSSDLPLILMMSAVDDDQACVRCF